MTLNHVFTEEFCSGDKKKKNHLCNIACTMLFPVISENPHGLLLKRSVPDIGRSPRFLSKGKESNMKHYVHSVPPSIKKEQKIVK